MQCVLHEDTALRLLVFTGAINAACEPEFQEILRQQMKDCPRKLVLDFGNVPEISLTAARNFLAFCKQSRACQTVIAVCKLQTAVADQFRQIGLTTLLPTFRTRGEAMGQ